MPANPVTASAGPSAEVGFSDNGQLMNVTLPALASLESDGSYEHFAIGEIDEGYAIFYSEIGGADHTAYDVFVPTLNVAPVSNQVVRNDGSELVKLSASTTTDGVIAIRQCFTWSSNATRVDIKMNSRTPRAGISRTC